MWYKIKRIYQCTNLVRPPFPVPKSWLLWYRPLQTDLKDVSNNWNNWSWYSGTGSFGTVWWYTWAKVTRSTSNWFSTQHIITPVNRSNPTISICWWICYTQMSDTLWTWRWLFWNWWSGSSQQIMLWLRSADNKYPYFQWNWTNYKLSSSTPSTNTWYFRVITRNGSTLKFYLNGTLANTLSISSSDIWNWVFKFGCTWYDSWWNWWTEWYVRHCAIYNKVLTDAEVLQFYNNTK